MRAPLNSTIRRKMKVLKSDKIRKFYDSFGSKQDKQFYEEAPISVLLEQGKLNEATSIVEFGCGTGKLASRLLKNNFSSNSKYLGLDISQTMVGLCQKNIEQFSEHAKCYKSEGEPKVNIEDQCADRFISTYVFDLLSEEDLISVLNEAHRILVPGGYLCLASLTHGVSLVSRIVENIWSALYRLNPFIVGGCHPIQLTKYLHNDKWRILYDSVVVSYGVPSEIVVAEKL